MSQYGSASKNPPWARNTDVSNVTVQQQLQSQMINQLGQQVMYQQQSQVFQPPMGLQQVANSNMLPQLNQSSVNLPGLNTAQLYGQSSTVSYPVPRALNSTAFGAGPVTQQLPPNQQPPSNQPPKQRVFTGTVTKVHDNFGFVDEDVFFQMSCCVKGSNPQIGDRVLVEASFNPNMPFKWNATRLQVLSLQNQGPAPVARKGFSDAPNNYSSVPPPVVDRSDDIGMNNFSRSRSPRRDRIRREADSREENDDRKRRRDSNDRSNRDRDRERDRERERERERDRDRDRERERERERDKDKEKGSTRSPSVRKRSKSPRKRRVRPAPRYMVHVPKIALDVPDADVLELRRRYSNMYIPSDFFLSNFRWVDAFPPNNPFTMDQPCSFHIMHRDTEPLTDNAALLDPPDADYLFSAKVMLMSMPQMGEFLKKCCQMSEDIDPESEAEGRDFVHPTRLVNFLVGLRGKNETMAIGGPWSPSLDGPNPEKDPQVLIRTAIRNCQALTGIDLSTCTQWYRFLEIYYRRGETTHKGKLVAARVETVVLFLPDVWSCVPTRLEWDGLHLNYKRQLDRKLKALLQIDYDEDAATVDEKESEEASVIKREPTPWNRLDTKSLKVSELREELEARSMSSKGLKNQLLARLQKALKSEQEAEEKGVPEEIVPEVPKEVEKTVDKMEDDENKKKEDEERKKQVEKEKVVLEKRYELPDHPHVIVHPNKLAKSGKFDCTNMSLSLLLDYRQDDTKEHSFEVSIFAELFNEMLMRDYGFRIYKSLYEAAEKVREEEREKERKKKEEKEKKEKEEKEKPVKEGDDKEESEKEPDAEKITEDLSEQEVSQDGDKRSRDGREEREDKDKKDKDRDSKDREKKKKEKMMTINPQLLLAFVYFDQSHCGYILDKDVEELMYALGLNLSRAQVRRLVQSVLSKDLKDSRENREALFYRRLTDKPKPEENGTIENSAEEPANDIKSNDIEVPLVGNRSLLPIFTLNDSGSPPSKRARIDRSEQASNVAEGFVMFKGGLLDVEKLTEQLKRSEKARVDTEAILISLREELSSTKKSAESASSTVQELTTKVEQLNDQLFTTTEQLNSTQAKSEMYVSTLKGIQDNINRVLPAVSPKNENCSDMAIKDEPSS